jgi:DNA polymerase IV
MNADRTRCRAAGRAHVLHMDVPDFLVSVERKHDPGLNGRPVIIGGQPTGWGRVVAASREAATRGVKAGMSLSVAASRCPTAVFLDGEFDRYLDASAAVDELLREPDLPVEWTSIDSVFLDVSPHHLTRAGGGTAGIQPGGCGCAGTGPATSRQIAERLQAALRDQLGFEASCGIASTKIAAQIASRLARPAGLLYVLPGYEERLLSALDVALLPDLPPGMAPRLHREGVLTLGHLADLDPHTAEGLLGRRAGELVRLARGLDDRAVDGTAPPRCVARDITFPKPTQSPAELDSVVQHLTETLASRLRRIGCFAQTMTVRARGGTPERTYSRSTTLREATATDSDLVPVAHALLHLLRRPRTGMATRAVGGLSVVLSNLHQGGAQMPLFPLSRAAATASAWTDLRSRASFQAVVRGHFTQQLSLGTRRAG